MPWGGDKPRRGVLGVRASERYIRIKCLAPREVSLRFTMRAKGSYAAASELRARQNKRIYSKLLDWRRGRRDVVSVSNERGTHDARSDGRGERGGGREGDNDQSPLSGAVTRGVTFVRRFAMKYSTDLIEIFRPVNILHNCHCFLQ